MLVLLIGYIHPQTFVIYIGQNTAIHINLHSLPPKQLVHATYQNMNWFFKKLESSILPERISYDLHILRTIPYSYFPIFYQPYIQKMRYLGKFGTFVFYHEVTLSSIEPDSFSWFHFGIHEKYFSSFRQIMSKLLTKAVLYNQTWFICWKFIQSSSGSNISISKKYL